MKKVEVLSVIALSTTISLLYYWPFLDSFFVWDDFWVLENAGGGLYKAFFGYSSLRIVGTFFLWLEYLISGLNPIGYSLISVFTHIVNTLLFYAFLSSLLSDKYLPSVAAIIFSGLAVFADAILWKAAYQTLMNFSFYILVLYLYVGWRKNSKQGYQILSLVAFSLGMFNKEEIASVPFMIILIECLFFEGRREIPTLVKRILPYFIVIILYVVLSFTLSSLFGLPQEQFDRFFGFRPLHTLLSGSTAFFISPEGRLSWSNPLMYITAVLIPLVQSRGNEWRFQAKPMKRFLSSIKKVQPSFPKNSYIHVVDSPTVKSYMQRSLRGFYRNPLSTGLTVRTRLY